MADIRQAWLDSSHGFQLILEAKSFPLCLRAIRGEGRAESQGCKGLIERFSQVSATHRYEIINKGPNSGQLWHFHQNLNLSNFRIARGVEACLFRELWGVGCGV